MASVRQLEKVSPYVIRNGSSGLCVNGTPWVLYLLNECVDNTWEYWSVVIGLVSMLCFLLSTLPQVYEAYRHGRVEQAVSLGFLLFLLSGDLSNFVGCYLTNQLPIQIVTAVFYIFTDVILISQFLYYKLKNAKSQTRNKPLLVPLQPKHADADPYLNYKENPWLKWICCVWCLAFTTVCSVLPKLLEEKKIENLNPQVNSTNVLEISGYAFGYLSSVFYLASRFPQLYKNFKRQSTEGTSYLLFALAMMGNGTYGLSLIVMLPALKGSEGVFILNHLAWLIGSLGVLFLDFFISAQFVLYRKQKYTQQNLLVLKKVPEVEPLLYADEEL